MSEWEIAGILSFGSKASSLNNHIYGIVISIHEGRNEWGFQTFLLKPQYSFYTPIHVGRTNERMNGQETIHSFGQEPFIQLTKKK